MTHSKKGNSKVNNKENTVRADSRAGAIQERGCDRSASVAIEATIPFLPIPRDDDDWRFARSFAPVGQEVAARAFFDEF
eukprot:6877316-Prymnesium_polylepis.1